MKETQNTRRAANARKIKPVVVVLPGIQNRSEREIHEFPRTTPFVVARREWNPKSETRPFPPGTRNSSLFPARQRQVFLGKHRILEVYRPFDLQRGIVETNASIVVFGVKVVAFVAKLGYR